MALPDFEAFYGGVPTELQNIQSVNWRIGREWIADPYSACTASIVCRDISNWPAIKPRIGQRLVIKDKFYNVPVFGGRIKDVAITYGELPSMDEAVISVEGILAEIGRRELTNQALAQARGSVYSFNIASAVGANVFYDSTYPGGSILSAQTYSGNALDALNQSVLTECGRLAEIWDAGTTVSPLLYIMARNELNEHGWTFSDVPGDWSPTVLPYNGIVFKSAAESYYTQITIQPQGLTTQVESSGAAPFYGLTQQSYDYSNTQADSHAQYLLFQFDNTNAYPTSISMNYSQCTSTAQRQRFARMIQADENYWAIGSLLDIYFRGTLYHTVIEGLSVSSNLNDTTATWHLSSQDHNAYLNWDTPAPFNTWDNNSWNF